MTSRNGSGKQAKARVPRCRSGNWEQVLSVRQTRHATVLVSGFEAVMEFAGTGARRCMRTMVEPWESYVALDEPRLAHGGPARYGGIMARIFAIVGLYGAVAYVVSRAPLRDRSARDADRRCVVAARRFGDRRVRACAPRCQRDSSGRVARRVAATYGSSARAASRASPAAPASDTSAPRHCTEADWQGS
jgi:hypothetical protein